MRVNELAILLLALHTACAFTDLADQTARPPGSAVKVQERPLSRDADKLEGAVIVLERSGGLLGLSERWAIHANGRVTDGQQEERTVASDKVSGLLAEAKELRFFQMQDAYGRAFTCNDCFTYRITVNAGDLAKTVTMVEGVSDVPAELSKLIDRIRKLVSTLPEK